MANKQALRDLQARLAERLQQVRAEKPGQSWLAVASGGRDFLLPLKQAAEIFELAPLVPVPHAARWLAGVVNLRGGVYTVVDLAQFLGLRGDGEAPPDSARLLSLNGELGVNAALRVDRLLGLRHAADMRPDDEDAENAARRPAFAGACWRDTAGGLWQEISLAELAATPEFLAIGS